METTQESTQEKTTQPFPEAQWISALQPHMAHLSFTMLLISHTLKYKD